MEESATSGKTAKAVGITLLVLGGLPWVAWRFLYEMRSSQLAFILLLAPGFIIPCGGFLYLSAVNRRRNP